MSVHANVWLSRIQQVRWMLGSFGEEQQVAEEKFLDMATALSGSGPMFYFFLMEVSRSSLVLVVSKMP